MAAAGAAGGSVLDIGDVFNTFLATGDGSGSLTINPGIDLATEGGMVWSKSRNNSYNHNIYDPGLGTGAYHQPNNGAPINTGANYSFTSTGLTDAYNNVNGSDVVWWNFRKANKFFDIQTWSGNGSSGRTISHNLGTTPGFIIVKRTNGTYDWICYHRSLSAGYVLYLNLYDTQDNNPAAFTTTLPTSSVFSVGDNNKTNETGGNYVAYIFAHNNNDGEFGPNSDQDIIKCGSFSSTNGQVTNVDLGFEPQWMLIKKLGGYGGEWYLTDTARGMPVLQPRTRTDYKTARLFARSDNTESLDPLLGAQSYTTQNGFSFYNQFGTDTWAYIAIRRGPLAQPETASSVFNCQYKGAAADNKKPFFRTNRKADAMLRTYLPGSSASFPQMSSRLMNTANNRTYNPPGSIYSLSENEWDFNNGVGNTAASLDSNHFGYLWSRAPGFFDVVHYTNSTAPVNLAHSLGVSPEMIWVKSKGYTDDWVVYHKGINGGTNPEQWYMRLNQSSSDAIDQANVWNDTAPTASVFTVGSSTLTGSTGRNFVAYLFATLAGISKVGSYTGDGTTDGSKVIDCGFTNGAKMVLIKSLSSGYGWHIIDSVRGIATGSNDPYFDVNSQNAQTTNQNMLGTNSSGFTVKNSSLTNGNGSNYIFYAVAI